MVTRMQHTRGHRLSAPQHLSKQNFLPTAFIALLRLWRL